jgi:hypothetical protein
LSIVPLRPLAWGLIAYGALGAVILVIVVAVGLDAAARAERLAGSADRALAAAADAAEAAADAVGGADESLERGAASASNAAVLSRDASTSLSSLGAAMELSIFGAQPLLPLADDFADTAGQASALADELEGVGGSLMATRSDIGSVGDRLHDLARELDTLRGAGEPDDAGMPPLRLLVGLLATWLGIPALAAVVAGVWLLRRTKVA